MSGHIFRSINPYTQQLLKTYEIHTPEQVDAIIARSHNAFQNFRNTSFAERAQKVQKLGQILQTRKEEFARIISTEMGKTILQSRAEIQKSADCCFYYAANGEKLLQPKHYDVPGGKCYIVYQPLGPILLIQPYNFPFWLPIKSCVPHLLAGNTILLKHAHNVPQCASTIEEITSEAGLQDEFLNLFVESGDTKPVIADPRVAGVSLTGSEKAGSIVGRIAGEHLKKSVLELGGSDPYIVLEDADIQYAVSQLITGRLATQGQVCISPKRVFVMESMHDQFVECLVRELENWVPGDPLNESTKIGPLAKPEAVTTLQSQIDKSVSMGAQISKGGKVIQGNLYPPTVLTHVTPEMPVFKGKL
jgi:succinate-semialdehyde dehydrogenase / glutarate-semialdehyde dehydrogenase